MTLIAFQNRHSSMPFRGVLQFVQRVHAFGSIERGHSVAGSWNIHKCNNSWLHKHEIHIAHTPSTDDLSELGAKLEIFGASVHVCQYLHGRRSWRGHVWLWDKDRVGLRYRQRRPMSGKFAMEVHLRFTEECQRHDFCR